MRHVTRLLLLAFCVTNAGLVACGGSDEPQGPGEGAGKSDWLGDGAVGASCSWNWQCAADQGLTCRPISHFVDGQWQTGGECAALASFLETCDEDADCSGGMFCKGGLCSQRSAGDDSCGERAPHCEGDAIVSCSVYAIERSPCPAGQTCGLVSGTITAPDGSTITLSRPECVDK